MAGVVVGGFRVQGAGRGSNSENHPEMSGREKVVLMRRGTCSAVFAGPFADYERVFLLRAHFLRDAEK